MGEEITHHEDVCRRQKDGNIAVGVGRGLRQQVQFLGPYIECEWVVESQRRPGFSRRSRNAPRKRRHILVGRQALAAICMSEHRSAGSGKSGIAVGMVEMPVRVDHPSGRPTERADDSVRYLCDAGTVAGVYYRRGLQSHNRGHIPAGAGKDENTGPDLRRQERSGLVGDPGHGDQPVWRKAVRGKAI
jgi:hypothetical protein